MVAELVSPLLSVAVMLIVCGPLTESAPLSHSIAYGGALRNMDAPSPFPSRLNRTERIPTGDVAVPAICTVPETVAPLAGSVTPTVGGTAGALFATVTGKDALPTFPARSVAVATK